MEFVWLAVVFVALWLLLVLPARRRQNAVQEMQSGLQVGSRVVTSGGIFGTVSSLAEDRIGLEVADGVVLSVARGAVVGLERPTDADDDRLENGTE